MKWIMEENRVTPTPSNMGYGQEDNESKDLKESQLGWGEPGAWVLVQEKRILFKKRVDDDDEESWNNEITKLDIYKLGEQAE